jgi:hypothetical protein
MGWIASYNKINTVANNTLGHWWTSRPHVFWLIVVPTKSICAFSPQHPSRRRNFCKVEVCNGVSVLDDGWLHVISILSYFWAHAVIHRMMLYDIIWHHITSYDAQDLANGAPFNTQGRVLARHLVVSCVILSFDNPLFSSDLVVGPLVKTGITGVFHDHFSMKLHQKLSCYITWRTFKGIKMGCSNHVVCT